MDEGTSPLIELLKTSSVSRFCRLPIVNGRLPVRKLLSSCRLRNASIPPNCSGMVPEMLLAPRRSAPNRANLPSSVGNVPERAADPMSKV
eukprot:2572826-Prymnesium_polylepis.1